MRRALIFRKTDWKCFYCGTDLGETPTTDHLTPTSRGGSNNMENTVACCGSCNSRKCNKTLDEYRKWYFRVYPDVNEILDCVGDLLEIDDENERLILARYERRTLENLKTRFNSARDRMRETPLFHYEISKGCSWDAENNAVIYPPDSYFFNSAR